MTHLADSPSSELFYTSPDGLRLHARHYPGPPSPPFTLLCLAGLTRNARDFSGLAHRLASQYRLLLADQRGRGRSDHDPNPDNYHLETYVSDMWRLIDHANVGDVVLIGTSLGGLIAMLMAAADPSRVRGIVLNDVGPVIDRRGLAGLAAYRASMHPVASWQEAVAQVRRWYAEIYPDFSSEQWLRLAQAIYREESSAHIVLDHDPEIVSESARIEPPDLWPAFRRLASTPVLVVRGEHSDILAADTLEAMRACHPLLQATVIPARGHAPTLEEPQALAAIEGFLSASSQRGDQRAKSTTIPVERAP